MRADRRRAARVAFRNGHLPPAARVRPGCDVIVVDLSTTGALVEGQWRFRPGSRCELALAFPSGEMLVRAKVARCFVARLARLTPVRYRAALAFEAVADVQAQGSATSPRLARQPDAVCGVTPTHAEASRALDSHKSGVNSMKERRT